MSAGERELCEFWRRAVRVALGLLVLGTGALLLLPRHGLPLAFGLLLGGAVSLLRFNLRFRALAAARTAGPLVRQRLFGYGLNALVLGAAFWRPETASPWTTAAGLLAMNVAVVAAELLGPRKAAADGTARGDLGPS